MSGQFYVLGETITKHEDYRSTPIGPFNFVTMSFHTVFGDARNIADYDQVKGRWNIDGGSYLQLIIFNGGEGVYT